MTFCTRRHSIVEFARSGKRLDALIISAVLFSFVISVIPGDDVSLISMAHSLLANSVPGLIMLIACSEIVSVKVFSFADRCR